MLPLPPGARRRASSNGTRSPGFTRWTQVRARRRGLSWQQVQAKGAAGSRTPDPGWLDRTLSCLNPFGSAEISSRYPIGGIEALGEPVVVGVRAERAEWSVEGHCGRLSLAGSRKTVMRPRLKA